VDVDASPPEREREPSRADAELERGARAGDGGEEVDGGVDYVGLEEVRPLLRVLPGDPLLELVLRHRTIVPASARARWVTLEG